LQRGTAAAAAVGSSDNRNGKARLQVMRRVVKWESNGSKQREEKRGQAEGCHGRQRGQQETPKDGKEQLAKRRGAARWVGRGFGKGQWSKEADRRFEKRQDVGPSNARSGVWGSSWVEKSAGAEFDAVGSRSSEMVPEKSPMTRRVGKRSVVGMSAEEVTIE